MAGALTERAFVDNLARAGCTAVAVVERTAYGLDELVREPTFPPELIALMRRLLPERVQQRVGVRLVVTAQVPAAPAQPPRARSAGDDLSS